MRKKISSHRKKVHVRSKSKNRIPKHLHFHMIYIYSTMCIFGLTLLVALAYPTLLKISERNTAYYSSNNHVLGISQKNSAVSQQKDDSLFKKFINLVTPK